MTMEGLAGKQSLPCLICTAPTLGTHFGVISCRACGAFFRRAVNERKQFTCRNGASCTYFKNIRHACKKCRYDRCIQFGMQEEVILTNKKVKSEESRPPSLPIQIPPLISQLVQNYRTLCSIRRATELALVPSRTDHSKIKGLENLSFGTSGSMSTFFRAHIPAVIRFISTSFYEFSHLTDEEKWQLLQPFFVFFWWADSTYRTSRMVEKELFNRICIMSETMYCDIARLDEWVDDMVLKTKVVTPNIKEFVRNRYKPHHQHAIFHFRKLEVTEEEYVVFVGLLFWNFGEFILIFKTLSVIQEKPQSENLKRVVNEARKNLYETMAFRQSGTNWEVRYGELLNLMNIIIVECLRAREELGLLNSLDTFLKEDFFYEMEICWTQTATPTVSLN